MTHAELADVGERSAHALDVGDAHGFLGESRRGQRKRNERTSNGRCEPEQIHLDSSPRYIARRTRDRASMAASLLCSRARTAVWSSRSRPADSSLKPDRGAAAGSRLSGAAVSSLVEIRCGSTTQVHGLVARNLL